MQVILWKWSKEQRKATSKVKKNKKQKNTYSKLVRRRNCKSHSRIMNKIYIIKKKWKAAYISFVDKYISYASVWIFAKEGEDLKKIWNPTCCSGIWFNGLVKSGLIFASTFDTFYSWFFFLQHQYILPEILLFLCRL